MGNESKEQVELLDEIDESDLGIETSNTASSNNTAYWDKFKQEADQSQSTQAVGTDAAESSAVSTDEPKPEGTEVKGTQSTPGEEQNNDSKTDSTDGAKTGVVSEKAMASSSEKSSEKPQDDSDSKPKPKLMPTFSDIPLSLIPELAGFKQYKCEKKSERSEPMWKFELKKQNLTLDQRNQLSRITLVGDPNDAYEVAVSLLGPEARWGPFHTGLVSPDGFPVIDAGHEIANFWVRQYFLQSRVGDQRNDPRYREYVLQMLEREERGDNPAAQFALKALRFVDAVKDLKDAERRRNPEATVKALVKIAALENDAFKGLTKFLDDYAGQGLKEDLTRRKQVELARAMAKDGTEGVRRFASNEMANLLGSTSTEQERKASLGTLKAAKMLLPGAEEQSSYQRAIDFVAANDSAQALLEKLNSPEEAKKQLRELLIQKKAGSVNAKEMLQALGVDTESDITDFVDKMRDNGARGEVKKRLSDQLYTEDAAVKEYRRFNKLSPEDILKDFPDQSKVKEAREEVKKFALETRKQSRDALQQFLSREGSDEDRNQTRADAIDKLKDVNDKGFRLSTKLRYSEELSWAKDIDAAQRLATAKTPQQALDAIRDLRLQAEGNSPMAKKLLEPFYSEKNQNYDSLNNSIKLLEKNNFSEVEYLRKFIPKGENEMNDYRVRFILADIREQSSVKDWQKVVEELERETRFGSGIAEEFLPWATVESSVAELNNAKTADEARAVVKKLAELSPTNEYARVALAQIAIAKGDRKMMLNWYAGESDGVKGKVMLEPRLDKLSPEVQRELQTTCALTLSETYSRPGMLSQLTTGEAKALSVVMAESNGDPAQEKVQQSLSKFFDAAIKDLGSQPETMKGLKFALEHRVKGSECLADYFVMGSSDPAFQKSFDMFNRRAYEGDEASLKIVAGAASVGIVKSDDLKRACDTLKTVASMTGMKDKVRDILVHNYQKHGDRALGLATLGEVTSARKNFNEDVRTVLRDGLAASDHKELTVAQQDALRASAVKGVLNNPEQWQEKEAELLTSKLTPDVEQGLISVGDRVPTKLHTVISKSLFDKLAAINDSTLPLEPYAHHPLLKAMRVFASGVTEEQVQTLSKFAFTTSKKVFDAKKQPDVILGNSYEHEAGLTMLKILASAKDEDAQLAAFAQIRDQKFFNLPVDRARGALIDLAKGRPADLDLLKEVSLLIYDAGIQRPTAGLFRDAGYDGTNQEQFDAVEQAIKAIQERNPNTSREDAEKRIRNMLANVDLYNSLNDIYKGKLNSKGNTPIDSLEVIGQLVNGTIWDEENSNHFLAGNLSDTVAELKTLESDKLKDIADKCKAIEEKKQESLRQLVDHTKKGVGFMDQVGTVAVPVLTYGVFKNDSIDVFYKQQCELVLDIRNQELLLDETQKKQSGPQAAITFYQVAQDSREFTVLMQQGKTREADRLAVKMWGENGDVLKQYAPQIWIELTKGGNRPIDRNVWMRLSDNFESSTKEMPIFSMGCRENGHTGPVFAHEFDVLKKLGNGSDAVAVRRQAFASIDASPELVKLQKAASVFSTDLNVLNQMFAAGMEGTKYDKFVADARTRAANVETAIKSISQEEVNAVKAQLAELDRAYEEIKNDSSKKEIVEELNARREQYRKLLGFFDETRTESNLLTRREQLLRMCQDVQSSKFDENTFINWLKKDGVVMIAAVAAAVAVTVLTAGTMGPVMVAILASGAALLAQELAKEGLFQAGVMSADERSLLMQWGTGVPDIDPETNRERKRDFLGDVAFPYLKQWAVDTVICLATMGVGKLGSGLINKMGTNCVNFFARHSKTVCRMQTASKRVQEIVKKNPQQASKINKFFKEFAEETIDEAKEEAAQEGVEKVAGKSNIGALKEIDKQLESVLGKGDHALGFIAASGLSIGKGVNFNRMRGTKMVALTNDSGGPLTSSELDEVVKGYKQSGCRVAKRADGTYDLRTPAGDRWVIGNPKEVSAALPNVALKPNGEAVPSKHNQKVGTPDQQEAESFKVDETAGFDATKGVDVRQQLEFFATAFANGDYDTAAKAARDGLNGADEKRVRTVEIDAVITEKDLSQANQVAVFLKTMQSKSSIAPDSDNGGKPLAERTYTMTVTKPILKLDSGVMVNLLDPTKTVGAQPRALSPNEQAQVNKILTENKHMIDRIKAEHALIIMEEKLIHFNQLNSGGRVISPTYAKFLSDNAVKPTDTSGGNEFYYALTSGKPGGMERTQLTYEQEVIAMLYDAGFPLSVIEHHFGKNWKNERQPIFDYLKKREAGTADNTKGKSNDAGETKKSNFVPPERQPVLRRDDAKPVDSAKSEKALTYLDKKAPYPSGSIGAQSVDLLRSMITEGNVDPDRAMDIVGTMNAINKVAGAETVMSKDTVRTLAELSTEQWNSIQNIDLKHQKLLVEAINLKLLSADQLTAGLMDPDKFKQQLQTLGELSKVAGTNRSREQLERVSQLDQSQQELLKAAFASKDVSPKALDALLNRLKGVPSGDAEVDATLSPQIISGAESVQLKQAAVLLSKHLEGTLGRNPERIKQFLELCPDAAAAEYLSAIIQNLKITDKTLDTIMSDFSSRARDGGSLLGIASMHCYLAAENAELHAAIVAIKENPTVRNALLDGSCSNVKGSRAKVDSIVKARANSEEVALVVDQLLSKSDGQASDMATLTLIDKIVREKLSPTELSTIGKILREGTITKEVLSAVLDNEPQVTSNLLELATSGKISQSTFAELANHPDASLLCESLKKGTLDGPAAEKLMKLGNQDALHAKYVKKILEEQNRAQRPDTNPEAIDRLIGDSNKAFDGYLDIPLDKHENPELVKAQRRLRDVRDKLVKQDPNAEQNLELNEFIKETVPRVYDSKAPWSMAQLADLLIRLETTPQHAYNLIGAFNQNSLRYGAYMNNPELLSKPIGDFVVLARGETTKSGNNEHWTPQYRTAARYFADHAYAGKDRQVRLLVIEKDKVGENSELWKWAKALATGMDLEKKSHWVDPMARNPEQAELEKVCPDDLQPDLKAKASQYIVPAKELLQDSLSPEK